MLNHQIRQILRRSTGLDVTSVNVERAVRRRMAACRVIDQDLYAARIVIDSNECEALIEQVVVPETWFFRNPEAFAAATRFARKRVASPAQRVRILSIPCASGEEPYSLAMALLDAGLPPAAFTIEGIDISAAALKHARHGIYHRNAFRTRRLEFRERYFSEVETGYALHRHVRDLVRFERGNLLALPARRPADRYDAIFCRNLLIYFDDATRRDAARSINGLLADDGLLFAGHAETMAFRRYGFKMAPFAHAFALYKQSADDGDMPRPLPSATPPLPTQSPPLPASPASRLSRDSPARRTVNLTHRSNTAAAVQAAPAVPSSVAPADEMHEMHGTHEKREAPEALLLQARGLADQGNTEGAKRAFQHYLQLVPDSDEAWFMLGLLNERPDPETAENYLRRAVYLNPGHYEALCHLALLAEQRGNASACAAYRKRAERVFQRRTAERKAEQNVK